MRRLARLVTTLLGLAIGVVGGFVAVMAWLGERGEVPLGSTRRFWAEFDRTRQPLFERLHGYVYSAFPYRYIDLGINGPHPALQGFWSWLVDLFPFTSGEETGTIADSYHGKVVPLEEATRLVRIDQEISLTVPEQVIPFDRARDIIMQEPNHIVALDCPCRMASKAPCLPLDVCLIVGEPFASFILEHHPDHSRSITPDEAARILKEEDERGHSHHAFFKEAMLERFYAICNCCSCCCGAMRAHNDDTPMLISSGHVAHVAADSCTACGTCAELCQFQAIAVPDGLAVVNIEECMGCGVCEANCPSEALSLVLEPTKGVPLHIQELMELAQGAAA